PAHAWTPWFAIFGSKSGFDSIEECFGDLTPKIYAIETGLSSDPLMNWRLSQLDNISLVSNSDAHSLPNLGREATVFELEKPTVQNIRDALDKKSSHPGAKAIEPVLRRSREESSMDSIGRPTASLQNDRKNKIAYTIEFYPQEGKYHYDGHLACKVSMAPEETKKHKGLCPKCKRPMTLGVDYRVNQLADRAEPKKNGEFKYIVPLQEIIADSMDQRKQSKKVQEVYWAMIKALGNEFSILLDVPIEKIEAFGMPELAEGIRRVRAGELYIEPGYDGQYGIVKVFKSGEQASARARQKTLF
ncbi:MAG: endonuclease Q family protein, partial [Patescibacteria group bacterium]